MKHEVSRDVLKDWHDASRSSCFQEGEDKRRIQPEIQSRQGKKSALHVRKYLTLAGEKKPVAK